VQANADHADPLSEADIARLHEAMNWLVASTAVGSTQPAR
jgi:hypothetical protein